MMPLCISLFFIGMAFFAKVQCRRRLYLLIGFLTLVITSNQFLVTQAFNFWEFKPKSTTDLVGTYDVGVVLTGGMINWSTLKTDHVGMGNSGDRFVQAFTLYKNQKIRKILISGASPRKLAQIGRGEGKEAKKFLVAWGVPEEDIILEEAARNTRENAFYTEKILSDQFPGQRYLLLTSSFHMKRSLACFEKVGLNIDTYPVDFYGGDYTFKWDFWIPEPDAIASFNLVWREWVGFWVYKLMGYC